MHYPRCICKHGLNSHRGGTDECYSCPCKKFAERRLEYGLRVDDESGEALKIYFPTKTRRNIFERGFRTAMSLIQNFERLSLTRVVRPVNDHRS